MKKNKNLERRLLILAIVFTIIIVAFHFVADWLNNYYRATDSAWQYINNPADNVSVEYVDNTIIFEPKAQTDTGFIFYPGAMVETESYSPIMEKLAENGIFVVVIQMPHYIAMLDANGARGIQAKYPEIDNWYIGGHSLGGAMASMYANRHVSEYEGLILMAAYSTSDLADDDIRVLSIRGSEDKVLNMKKYDKRISYLPSGFKEVVIDGGCHAYFGDYGLQDGDGVPSITVEEQIDITVDEIVDFIK